MSSLFSDYFQTEEKPEPEKSTEYLKWDRKSQIVETLSNSRHALTPQILSEATDMPVEIVRDLLRELVNEGAVETVGDQL